MIDDTPDSIDAAGAPARRDSLWDAPPSAKARTGVLRAVERLLDMLAPEREVRRGPRLPVPVERHRTPRGCILQAATAAVSVSWFPDAATDMTFGGLQILAWRGVVSRPGSAHREAAGASIARELLLRPDEREASAERGAGEWLWRAEDGTSYDTDALAAYCFALLEQLMAGGATDHQEASP